MSRPKYASLPSPHLVSTLSHWFEFVFRLLSCCIYNGSLPHFKEIPLIEEVSQKRFQCKTLTKALPDSRSLPPAENLRLSMSIKHDASHAPFTGHAQSHAHQRSARYLLMLVDRWRWGASSRGALCR